MAIFGYTGADGASTRTFEGIIRAGLFTCSENGTPTSITARLSQNTADNHDFEFALYKASDNSLIAETVQGSKSTTTEEEITLAIDGKPTNLIAGEDYYICVWGTSGPGVIRLQYIASVGTSDRQTIAYTGTWPDPFVPEGTAGETTDRYDIYCTYTPAPSASTPSGYLKSLFKERNPMEELRESHARLRGLI